MINTVVDERFTEYLSSSSTKKSTRELGKEVKRFILDDSEEEGSAWFEIRFFLRVVEPLFKLVRLADGAKPQAAQLYYRLSIAFNDLEDALRTQPELAAIKGRLQPLLEVLEYRRTYMHSEVYGAAFALHPEYHRKDAGEMDRGRPIMDLMAMAERLLIDHGNDPQGAILAAQRLDEGGPVGKCMAQFARFKAGDFAGKVFLEQARSLTGAAWWGTLGKMGLPELAYVAVRVLSMVPAAAGCERNWSLMGAVTAGKHARMSSETMSKLVYVRANLQLMYREYVKGKEACEESGVLWEDDEDMDDDDEMDDDEDMDDGSGGGGDNGIESNSVGGGSDGWGGAGGLTMYDA